MLFYDPRYYFAHPLDIFKVWEGGMAFHGGLIGAFIGVLLFARRYHAPVLTVLDLCSLAAPIGLFLGRIANFIRPELWGRPTDVPWAVVFPGSDGLPRHPSQIYEALLEGLLAFVDPVRAGARGALKRPGPHRRRVRRPLRSGAHFLRVLSRARSAPRGPRRGLTMGMVLSAPLIVIGLGLLAMSLSRRGQPEMTTLLDEIKALIAESGPITVERYMELALAHPEFGYYMNRDPFGATGDFTTAPEISQMFGELIGLWAAEVWTSMGSPNPVRLIELGPGRGTLMSDALRAARIVPEFRAALDVWLDGDQPDAGRDPARAAARLRRAVAWAQSLEEIPPGPAIVIANEFLDALPVRQFVRVGGQWRERVVRLNDEGELAFDLAHDAGALYPGEAPNGEVLEVNPAGHRFMFELGARLVKQGGAALFIDYGHAVTGFGDTLQALRAHRSVDPLVEPGECDLTAHVDFAAMARSASAAGAAVYGPIDQGDFLRAIGIDLRAKALADRAGPERAEEMQQARHRLVGKGKGEMGALFKAMAVANRSCRPRRASSPGEAGVSARPSSPPAR